MQNTNQFDMAEIVSCQTKERSSRNDINCSYHTNCVTTEFPNDTVVAMAYVPFQLDKTSYSAEMALYEGTLFPVLNKPFCGRSVMNG